MKPVSILYVDNYWEFGGGQVSLLSMLRNLDRKRWRPSLVVNCEGKLAEEARAAGVAVHVISMGRGKWRYFWVHWPAFRQIRDFARGQGAAIVHNNGLVAATLGGPIAMTLGIKSVWHKRIHVTKRRASSTAFRWRLYGRTQDLLLAVSAAVGHDLERIGIPAGKIRVIPNFVDETFLKGAKVLPATVLENFGIPLNTPLVGVIAARRWHKGLDLFLKAAAIVRLSWKGDGPAPEFLMIGPKASGEGDFEAKLERLVAAPGLKGHVHHVPFAEKIGDWYKTLDLLVCPSRREGFGRTAVEAMLALTPVVASYPEAAEIIEHGVTGLLSPPGYVDELAKSIEAALRDKAGSEKRATAARKVALSRFGPKRYMQDLEKIYDELLEGKA